MSDELLFDRFRVTLFVPAGVDPGVAAARAAIDGPVFLGAVRHAVRAVVTATPALAVLAVTPALAVLAVAVEW